MQRPKVSVIIPAYNIEMYISKCLDSIISQTYADLEIIIINDGSTDSSFDIMQSYAYRDKRIILINHKTNHGVSIARNEGINISTGEFITFVDGDDYISPDMIELLVNNSLYYGANISTCNFLYVDKLGNEKVKICNNKPQIKSFNRVATLILEEERMLHFLTEGISGGPWGVLFRANLFENIRFPTKRIYEDLFIMHELVHKAKRIVLIPEICYFYLYRENSILTQTTQDLDMVHGIIERTHFISDFYPEYIDICRQAIIQSMIICIRNLHQKGLLEYCQKEIENVAQLIDCDHIIQEGNDVSANRLINLISKHIEQFIKIAIK